MVPVLKETDPAPAAAQARAAVAETRQAPEMEVAPAEVTEEEQAGAAALRIRNEWAWEAQEGETDSSVPKDAVQRSIFVQGGMPDICSAHHNLRAASHCFPQPVNPSDHQSMNSDYSQRSEGRRFAECRKRLSNKPGNLGSRVCGSFTDTHERFLQRVQFPP